MKEALYYSKNDSKLICNLCPHYCHISKDRTGFCRTRKNIEGTLYALNYGKVTAAALDPIEKKPLYHFYPGSFIFSIGTFGCNFKCGYCQNWQIAHDNPTVKDMLPADIAFMAKELRARGNIGVAYTYSEPGMWYEFILDCAKLIHNEGMKNVVVTNGFINPEPLKNLLPFIDALNIDVKGYTNEFYKTICAGNLDAVKRTVEICAAHCHVEITYLVVPDLNDKQEDIYAFSEWLSGIKKDIPVHFTRYFPNYKLNKPPTAVESLVACQAAAAKHLKYVYIGNVSAAELNR